MTVVHLTPNPVIPDRFLRQQRGVRALGYSHCRQSLRGNITAVRPKFPVLETRISPELSSCRPDRRRPHLQNLLCYNDNGEKYVSNE